MRPPPKTRTKTWGATPTGRHTPSPPELSCAKFLSQASCVQPIPQKRPTRASQNHVRFSPEGYHPASFNQHYVQFAKDYRYPACFARLVYVRKLDSLGFSREGFFSLRTTSYLSCAQTPRAPFKTTARYVLPSLAIVRSVHHNFPARFSTRDHGDYPAPRSSPGLSARLSIFITRIPPAFFKTSSASPEV